MKLCVRNAVIIYIILVNRSIILVPPQKKQRHDRNSHIAIVQRKCTNLYMYIFVSSAYAPIYLRISTKHIIRGHYVKTITHQISMWVITPFHVL